MTEKEIQLLGFEKNTSFGGMESFYYYTYDIVNGLSFISCADDEVKDGNWYVEFFNTENPIRFYKFEEVQTLINLIEKRLI